MIHDHSVFFEILLQIVICYIFDLINKKGAQLGFFHGKRKFFEFLQSLGGFSPKW